MDSGEVLSAGGLSGELDPRSSRDMQQRGSQIGATRAKFIGIGGVEAVAAPEVRIGVPLRAQEVFGMGHVELEELPEEPLQTLEDLFVAEGFHIPGMGPYDPTL